jgi:hypothetical protein
VVAALFVFGALVTGAMSAAADEPPVPPLYDGGMTFGEIHGPADPEEYSWTVELSEDQVLRAIDDQHAAVYYGDREVAFGIAAQPAHDADGSAVPTTIAVSDGDVVTLTVHHRAGNPAASGAPFVYPILGGSGWEGGFRTIIVPMPGPERMPGDPVVQSAPTPECTVPILKGWSLKVGRKRLREAGCGLGEVRGARSKTAKVVRQSPRPGVELPAGAEVGVKLGG